MRVRLAGAALCGVLLAGCAGPAPAEAPATSPSETAVRTDPIALIGLWKVDGQPAGTVLRVDGDGELGLFQRCVDRFGSWRANDTGQFVGSISTFSTEHGKSGCAAADKPTSAAEVQPEWLSRITGYRAEGASRLLLDDSGTVVTRLLAGAVPATRSNMDSSMTGRPTVTDKSRQLLGAAAVPLPAGLTPVTTSNLLGTWRPAGRTTKAHAEFRAGGRWEGSDGCNGQSGGWVAGPGGALLAVDGVQTLVGCDSVPIGLFLRQTRRAGLDGGTLVLLDAAGKELLRLTR
ncbi:META domain-containing protein [Actinoplanes regularis]|uniref:META domain-containing protein n=1 Tax=Actinoplanes regularis TaxID=52697 RepID=A0A239JAA3_9ACTN|nr:META domain-containing protein [Actinoplanes regularis]SNT02946.1 META domain-containing protein [Actinoplanes regularis]